MKAKLKTHSGAKKRFKRTASGLYVHRSANRGHHFTEKPQKRKRQLRSNRVLHASSRGEIRLLLGGKKEKPARQKTKTETTIRGE